MSLIDHKAIAALEYLNARGFYSTAYTDIVQPDRVFAVTDYFRRYWVTLLKPGPAWLVVALRQRCYWNGQRAWCTVSRDTLAADCGASTRSVDNYLALPAVSWFISNRQARYTRRADGAAAGSPARLQRDWTRYSLRLDEPLAPAHQAALAALAADLARACPPDADPALFVAQQLLDMDIDELWQKLERVRGKIDRVEEWKDGPRPIAEIIQSAVQSLIPNPQSLIPNPQYLRACDALYLRIVRPDKVYIATQYFRLRWVPLLGAARAWLVLHLRSRCYLNSRQLEVRDTCTVAGLGELAAILGVSLSTIKTCLAEPPADILLAHLATRRPGAGRVEMDFRVEMIDPLVPADRTRYAELDQKPDIATRPGGQQPDFAVTSDQEPYIAASPPGQKLDFAGIPGQQPDSTATLGEQKPDFAATYWPGKGQDLQDTRLPSNTSERLNTQQQVLLEDDDPRALLPAAGSLPALLAWMKIDEPSRSRVLALAPSYATALAWALEAWAQDRIANKPGFVVSMLLAGHVPPSDLERLAGLSPARWRELVRSVRLGQVAGLAGLPAAPAAGDADLAALQARLGHLPVSDWPAWLPGVADEYTLEQESDRSRPAGPTERELAETDLVSPGLDLSALWAAVLDLLRAQMSVTALDTYLADARLVAVDGPRWTVAAPYPYLRDWLRSQYALVIRQAASQVAGGPAEVEFIA